VDKFLNMTETFNILIIFLHSMIKNGVINWLFPFLEKDTFLLPLNKFFVVINRKCSRNFDQLPSILNGSLYVSI